MPKKRKQIRFQEGDDNDWSGSSSSGSSRSSVASFHRDSYPRKGRTRIPARLVSKRALVDLGYPFVEDGALVVLLVALDERLIDEVLKLSEEYRRSDQDFFGGGRDGRESRDPENQARDRGFDWVNIETPETIHPLPDLGYHDEAGASENDSDLLSNDTDADETQGPVAYSGVLGLNTTKVFGENHGEFTAGKFPAWNQERSDLVNSTTTLFLVHAAEFYMDRAGKHRVTLVCPNRPENHHGDPFNNPSLVRMRWLHVQAQPLNIATLESLVADCPYISPPLKVVALTVLKEVTSRCVRPSETGSYIEPGSTVQYVGRYNRSLGSYPGDEVADTEPVVFLSAPYLVLADKLPRKRQYGSHHTRSLLEVLYGYDGGTFEESNVRGKSEQKGGSKSLETLQVPQLWSLTIGAELIITCSEMSSEEIGRDLITIDGKESRTGVYYTIRLIDERDTCRYHIVIKKDCKYVDFLRHAVSLVRKGRSTSSMAYVLVSDSGVLITPDKWLHLLEKGSIEEHVFCLRPKDAAHQMPDDDIRALSARLTAGSRSSLGTYSRRSSFRSELRRPEYNMQMVVHPRMWEYGAGSQRPESEDGMASDKDADIDTLTMSFDSRSNEDGAEDSSYDGIVDLTSSASETSLGLRRTPTLGSLRSDNHVPELFDMDRHTGFRRRRDAQNERRYPSSQDLDSGGRPEQRFFLRRRETARSADSRTTDPGAMPLGPGDEYSPRQSWSRSRASSFTYAHGSPLDPGRIPSPVDPSEPLETGSRKAASFRHSGLGSFPGAGSTADFEAESPPPFDIPDGRFVPFLAWRLTWRDDKRTRADVDRTLFQLLSNLNAGLEADRTGKWYKTAFECTQNELTERFECLVESVSSFSPRHQGVPESGGSTADSSTCYHVEAQESHPRDPNMPELPRVGNDPEGVVEPPASNLFGPTDVESTDDGLRLNGRAGESTDPPQGRSARGTRRQSYESISHTGPTTVRDRMLLGKITEVSRAAFGAFLPSEGGFAAHAVCKRFWGSVDSILRQIVWSWNAQVEAEKRSWAVSRSAPRSPAAQQRVTSQGPGENRNDYCSGCSDCHKGKTYEAVRDALDHWHDSHVQTPCSWPARPDRPFDDPCFAWICRTEMPGPGPEPGVETEDGRWSPMRNSVVSSAETFYAQVKAIVDQTEELHKLVTSAAAPDDPYSSNDPRPHLPSSLVNAFEGLISIYVLKAKELSWMNRFTAKVASSHYSQDAERRLDRLREAGHLTSGRVRQHLTRAKEDIIMLGTTKGDSERIVIAPIGPEFLAASLLSSLQNSVPVLGTEKKLDLVNHYRSQTARLCFDTSRRPNRKAFVEIHALEEELEALRAVVASQQHLLRSYQKLYSPLAFRSRTTDRLYYKERKASFKLENRCIRRQQRRLAERDRALSILQLRARTLRDETKQRIEILDEGHGKAIRVFTIVTLFFLPL
ncbi:hypothetical protein CTA2_7703 [Colletotrichum tanaceti]|nr:hypothetical protein CTA2_7703 [Colletotrichum tanaceti]